MQYLIEIKLKLCFVSFPCQVHQKILITNYGVFSEIPTGRIS